MYPECPLFDVVDPDALRLKGERFSTLPPLEKHQVPGAVASLIWLGDLVRSPAEAVEPSRAHQN